MCVCMSSQKRSPRSQNNMLPPSFFLVQTDRRTWGTGVRTGHRPRTRCLPPPPSLAPPPPTPPQSFPAPENVSRGDFRQTGCSSQFEGEEASISSSFFSSSSFSLFLSMPFVVRRMMIPTRPWDDRGVTDPPDSKNDPSHTAPPLDTPQESLSSAVVAPLAPAGQRRTARVRDRQANRRRRRGRRESGLSILQSDRCSPFFSARSAIRHVVRCKIAPPLMHSRRRSRFTDDRKGIRERRAWHPDNAPGSAQSRSRDETNWDRTRGAFSSSSRHQIGGFSC